MHRLWAGAGRGGRAPLRHWLLVRGSGDSLLPERHGDRVAGHSSTRRPSVEPGDRAVLYAAGWQVIYGLAEVAGEADHDPGRERWGWRFPLRPLLLLDDLRDAPPVQAAGVMTWSLGRHSYVRLAEEQFAAARVALEDAADGAEPPA